MSVNLLKACRELFVPANRITTVVLALSFGIVDAVGWASGSEPLRHGLLLAATTVNVGYGLETVRRIHQVGDAAVLPRPLDMLRRIPLTLKFMLLNVPHFMAWVVLVLLSGLFAHSPPLQGLTLFLLLLYVGAWILAYDALAINFMQSGSLSDAFNLGKAFRLFMRAPSNYLRAAWLPFLAGFPISLVLTRLTVPYHLAEVASQSLGQVCILANLLMLKQFWLQLQRPEAPGDVGLTPTPS